MRFRLLGMCVLLTGLFAESSLAQDSCRMERYSEIPITTLPDGRFTVPVAVNGQPLNFLVDTGGVTATIEEAQAERLQLSRQRANPLQGVAGRQLNFFAVARTFSLGRLQGEKLPVYIHPSLPDGADGTLSPDMMKHFDVDIDLPRGTLSLFSQNHCPGKVVHWTRTGYVVLPMQVTQSSGHIEVPVMVDGKKFVALLDTGARHSVISMRAAKALGISEDSPDMKLLSGGDTKYKRYSYPFKVLDFDGVSVTRPHFEVVSDDYLPGRGMDMIIGNGILRRLHLYIAYGEEKLYITPALAN